MILKREDVDGSHPLDDRARLAGWFPAVPERYGFAAARLWGDPEDTRQRMSLEPDPELRDYENVPLKDDVEDYFRSEVLPHVPEAWMDRDKDKIGYEINFNRHFYRFVPPRPLDEIDHDLRKSEVEIVRLLREVTA